MLLARPVAEPDSLLIGYACLVNCCIIWILVYLIVTALC